MTCDWNCPHCNAPDIDTVLECWSCERESLESEYLDNDGLCTHCGAEVFNSEMSDEEE